MKSCLIFLIEAVLLLFSAQYAEANPLLYSVKDSVVILTTNNVTSNIYNSSQNWLVQFYAHWCGHCQRFSRIYKEFARTVNDSDKRNLVQIAVVDCADEINESTCRDFHVSKYPTFRFFSKNTPLKSQGLEFTRGKNVTAMHIILDNLLKTVTSEVQDYETIPEQMNVTTIPSNKYLEPQQLPAIIYERIPETFEIPNQQLGDVGFQEELEDVHFSPKQKIPLHNVTNGEKKLYTEKNAIIILSISLWVTVFLRVRILNA